MGPLYGTFETNSELSLLQLLQAAVSVRQVIRCGVIDFQIDLILSVLELCVERGRDFLVKNCNFNLLTKTFRDWGPFPQPGEGHLTRVGRQSEMQLKKETSIEHITGWGFLAAFGLTNIIFIVNSMLHPCLDVT